MAIDPTPAAAGSIARRTVQRAAANALAGTATDLGVDLTDLFGSSTARPRVEPGLPARIASAAADLFQGARELLARSSSFTGDQGGGFDPRTVLAGDDAITGAAANGAGIREFQVDVVQRAAGQRNNGARLDPTQNTSIDTGTNTVAMDIDGQTRVLSFDVGVAATNQQALQSFAGGVTAEVRATDAGGVRLRITRDDTGAEATFNIRDLQGNVAAATGAGLVRRKARDTEVIVDGQTLTSTTNIIELEGGAVSLQINRVTDGAVTVGVAPDTEAQAGFVQGFVSEFNDFRAFLNENAAFVNDQLQRDLDAAVQSQTQQLAAVGISHAAGRALQIDEERLTEALTDNPERVQDLFTNFNGLATRVGALAQRVATTAPSTFISGSVAEAELRGGASAFNSAGAAVDSPLIAPLTSGLLIDALF